MIVESAKFKFIENELLKLGSFNLMTHSLMVMLTKACQLRCNYCEVILENLHMPKEILIKSVDLISRNGAKSQIRFFGGEPLLRFKLIKEAIEYAERKRPNVRFSVVTNGIMLDRNKLDFFKRHHVHVMFSIDGIRKMHNLQ